MPVALYLAALLLALAGAPAARAQYIQNYFPTGIPGYAGPASGGIAGESRALYDPEDIHVGGFDIRPQLSEGFAYDSNVEGIAGGPGSLIVQTTPSLQVNSDWVRNALGFSINAEDDRYLSLPIENHTDFSVSTGGTYTLGRGGLNAGFSYLSEHELATELGALQTTNAVPYTVIDGRLSLDVVSGRFTFTPNFDVQQFSFGTALIDGVSTSQSYRDRQVLQGGLTTRFDFGDQRGLLLVLQGVRTSYTDLSPGLPNNGSTGFLGLTGLDYQGTGLFRYQLLGGLETRSFAAPIYGSQVAPVAEASVIWSPTTLTTITDTLFREIDSPASIDVGDVTTTSDTLVIDHELRRNVILQARFTAQLAEYLHQSSQNSLSGQAVATWLISKRLRLSATYSYSRLSGAPVFTTTPDGQSSRLSGGFTDNRFTLTLRVTP
jgi:hypothetical protein